jgi:dUTP pyrophosphatase
MDRVTLKIKRIRKDAIVSLPKHMSAGSSGLDLCVDIENDIILQPLERKLIPTGIAVSIPDGFEGQVRPRSGLAIKHGITLLNSPGTIDSDYRGELQLIVINLSQDPFTITNGMRLAQLVISSYASVAPVIVDELDETDRGAGGFGHTGI